MAYAKSGWECIAAAAILIGASLGASPGLAAKWGSVSQRCEGETTVYYSRVDAGGGSWETACQDTPLGTPSGTSVTFLRKDHGARNYACQGAACRCSGKDCSQLVSMKCVHRGVDGMWGEVRMNGAACRASGRWGAFTRESCGAGNADKYFARIDVQRGSWENACRSTAARINDHLTAAYDPGRRAWGCQGTACLNADGQPREFSARCVNRQSVDKGMAGMWLEVTLENPGCPAHWGEFAKTCPEVGTAEYEARLWGVPKGSSWEEACVRTPADYLGRGVTVLPNPEQCHKDGILGTGAAATGMWSRFRVSDASCLKVSFNDRQRMDHCVATLPDVQRVWTPRLLRLREQVSAGVPAATGDDGTRAPAGLDVAALTEAVGQRHQGRLSRDELRRLAAPLARAAAAAGAADAAVLAPASAARAATAVDRPGLIYSLGGAVSGGAFFGLAAEQGVAAWFDGRENLRGYTTFGHSAGLQLSAGGEGVFGIWAVNDLAALGGDAWGCSVGASTGTGVGGALTAWFDFENRYLGATLAPGVSVGITPVESTLSKVHTFVY